MYNVYMYVCMYICICRVSISDSGRGPLELTVGDVLVGRVVVGALEQGR